MAEQLIVFCSNYRRELESINLQDRFGDIEVAYFPSRCGMPPIEWTKLQEKLPDMGDHQELRVVSCGGIKGLSENFLILDKHYSYDFKQCYHLITSPDLAEYYIQKGFYLVTPGWLAHWPDILAGWGFDQPAAANFFKETARAILLLDTGVDSTAEANLAEFARYVERPCETVKVGLDYLKLLLGNTVFKSRAESNSEAERTELAEKRREFAEFAMTLDLLNTLARVRQEETVLENIKTMFTMLFAPREVNYRAVTEENSTAESGIINDADSFILMVQGSSGLLGYLDIIGVNQPGSLEQYKKLAKNIVNICGLAIENARHYQTIKNLSDTDGLTGIANRRKLEEHLAAEWRRLQREQKPLAVLMCDIDFFKHYNDLYGHQAGDDCLKAVAAVLARNSQRSGDLAARYGGEEFTLILPHTDLETAGMMGEKVRGAVEKLKLKNEGSSVSDFVTISIGVASLVPASEISADELIGRADKALYKAKSAGRNQVRSAS